MDLMDILSDEFYEMQRCELKKRLKPKRYEHSLGVAHTAEALAQRFCVDVAKARLAGLLHDWDKCYSAEAIQERARVFQVDVLPEVIDEMPQVLHGFTAACALQEQFPELPADVVQAIRLHTTGALIMDDLAKIIFVADVIEPHRDFPGVEELREIAKTRSLDELYFCTYRSGLRNLIDQGQRIFPGSLDVWNNLVDYGRA